MQGLLIYDPLLRQVFMAQKRILVAFMQIGISTKIKFSDEFVEGKRGASRDRPSLVSCLPSLVWKTRKKTNVQQANEVWLTWWFSRGLVVYK